MWAAFALYGVVYYVLGIDDFQTAPFWVDLPATLIVAAYLIAKLWVKFVTKGQATPTLDASERHLVEAAS